MRISFFESALDNVPKPYDLTWEQLVAWLLPHKFRPSNTDKRQLPAVCFAEFAAPLRNSKNAVRAHAIGFDFDGISDAQLDFLVDKFDGYQAILYSTWSQATEPVGSYRVRGVVNMTRPVEAHEWPVFWQRANSFFGGFSDQACKNLDRIFFLPIAPEGSEVLSIVFDGIPLDPASLLNVAAAATPQAVEYTKVSKDAFERAMKRACKSKISRIAETGELLKLVFKGEVFALPGARDDAVYQMSLVLGDAFPKGDPDSIADIFATSLQVMSSLEGAITRDDVADKIRRRQDAIHLEEQAEEQKKIEEQNARLAEAWSEARPYTVEELKSFEAEHGSMQHRWLIQRAQQVYVFFNGTYRSYSLTDVVSAVVVDLAPAVSAGVELTYVNERGQILKKPLSMLIDQYGTVAAKVIVDLTIDTPYFDPKTKTLTEAPCPLRPIVPRFVPEVDEFLKLLAGPKYYKLVCWVAACSLIEDPCVALLLTGAPGTGKSLLMYGLARMWTATGGPTTLEAAMGNFNEDLLHCPLVFADEVLPKDFRGLVRTGDLREFIQSRSREHKKKYAQPSPMVGAVRIGIAGNDEGMLATGENLTVNDIDAITDRLLPIETSIASRDFLRSIGHSGVKALVDGDLIAAHSLWLSDPANFVWEREGRFMIRGDNAATAIGLVARQNVPSALIEWHVNYLIDPEKFNKTEDAYLVRIHKGRLLSNVKGPASQWVLYVKSEFTPKTGHLGRALSNISKTQRGQPIQLVRPNTKTRENYHEINMEVLLTWNREHGYVDESVLLKALETDTEELEQRRTHGKKSELN